MTGDYPSLLLRIVIFISKPKAFTSEMQFVLESNVCSKKEKTDVCYVTTKQSLMRYRLASSFERYIENEILFKHHYCQTARCPLHLVLLAHPTFCMGAQEDNDLAFLANPVDSILNCIINIVNIC